LPKKIRPGEPFNRAPPPLAPRSRLPAAKIDFSLNATMQITVKPHFLDAAAHRTPMRA